MVLGFDDYTSVPAAKGITQALRRARVTPMPFEADDPMFEAPPEPWDAAMANRTFKAAVQRFIIEALPTLLEPPGSDQPYTLIVDWTGPEGLSWTWDIEGGLSRSTFMREQVRQIAPARSVRRGKGVGTRVQSSSSWARSM